MTEKIILNALTDEKLMELYCNGDEKAFHEIYKRYSSRIFSFIKRRVSDPSMAAEIFQNVFEKFHKHRDSFESKFLLSQWVFTMTKNCIIDEYRKNSIPFQELTEDLYVDSPENPNHLDIEVLDRLNDQQRQVVKMRVFDELSYQEISEKINKSEVSIRKIFSRAVEKLKNEK